MIRYITSAKDRFDVKCVECGIYQESGARFFLDHYDIKVSFDICTECLLQFMHANNIYIAIGTNSGHGHVWKRPDGFKARCGGPRFCSECASDMAAIRLFS